MLRGAVRQKLVEYRLSGIDKVLGADEFTYLDVFWSYAPTDWRNLFSA
jgi:hypothetical protein